MKQFQACRRLLQDANSGREATDYLLIRVTTNLVPLPGFALTTQFLRTKDGIYFVAKVEVTDEGMHFMSLVSLKKSDWVIALFAGRQVV